MELTGNDISDVIDDVIRQHSSTNRHLPIIRREDSCAVGETIIVLIWLWSSLLSQLQENNRIFKVDRTVVSSESLTLLLQKSSISHD